MELMEFKCVSLLQISQVLQFRMAKLALVWTPSTLPTISHQPAAASKAPSQLCVCLLVIWLTQFAICTLLETWSARLRAD